MGTHGMIVPVMVMVMVINSAYTRVLNLATPLVGNMVGNKHRAYTGL